MFILYVIPGCDISELPELCGKLQFYPAPDEAEHRALKDAAGI